MCDRDLICNYSNIFSRKLIQISKYIHSHIRDWVFLIPLNENIIKRERCCVTRNVCFDEIFGFLVLNKHPEYTVIYFSNVVQKMLKVNFVSSLTLFLIKKILYRYECSSFCQNVLHIHYFLSAGSQNARTDSLIFCIAFILAVLG